MSDWVSLLSMDETQEEHWITDKEDGCVLANRILDYNIYMYTSRNTNKEDRKTKHQHQTLTPNT